MLAGAPIGVTDIGGSGLEFDETTDLVEADGICVDFTSDALTDTPSWTRLDDGTIPGVRVSRWELRRGRSVELDKTDTGTATIYGTDTDGNLDPTNTGSPYGAGLSPGRPAQIALRNPVTDTWSTLIRGHVAEFRYEVEFTENVIHWEIEVVGPFDLIAATAMIPGVHGDTPPQASLGDVYFNEDASLDACQTRINKILDDVGYPASMREIFTGNVGLQGNVYPRLDSALSALYDTADAEFPGVANIFERKDGAIVFHGRFARFDPTNPSYRITEWAAGDDPACASDDTLARINGITFSKGKTHLINAATATPKGITETDVPGNHITDTLSIAADGVRSEAFTDLLTLNGDGPTTAVEETRKFATYYVDNFAEARTRIDSIVFKSQHPDGPFGPAQWALICGIDISDTMVITTTHPGGGGFPSQTFFVEGVTYTCEPARPEYDEVTLTVDLSPADYYDSNPFD